MCVKSPNEAVSFTNMVACKEGEFKDPTYVLIRNHHDPIKEYAFTIKPDSSGKIQANCLGFNYHHRKWAELSENKQVTVSVFNPQEEGVKCYLNTVNLEIDFFKKGRKALEPNKVPLDAKELKESFIQQFTGLMLSIGQELLFVFDGIKYDIRITHIEGMGFSDLQNTMSCSQQMDSTVNNTKGGCNYGIVMSQTALEFEKREGSNLKIKGTIKGGATTNLINTNFNFEQLGIGGLDKEFSIIFRRAFASRILPPDLVGKLGLNHVKGILLYGPPGCGKTLMARQIGTMLNAREPKIVNGPELLNKYVGASEENIRNLFADAELEAAESGDYSQLHIIIFDEIDAICKQRGNQSSSAGVGDNIVNQLLTKMDGYNSINNVLIIGMTNRKDLIDTALLRPGRLEVQMEINLPDEDGRLQILNIHTTSMRGNNLLDEDVSLSELASMTKNYSGAEIGGVVKAASSYAFYRTVDVENMGKIDQEKLHDLKLYREDFLSALADVQPLFGKIDDDFDNCMTNGILKWDECIERILEDGRLYGDLVKNSARTPLLSMCLEGTLGVGKTALAASIALNSDFPFIKLIAPEMYVGMNEFAKCNAITKVFDDAYKSPLSCIVVDNIERLLEYVPIGPRFSNNVLQTLLVVIKKAPIHKRRLLVIATSSRWDSMVELGFNEVFDATINVPALTTPENIVHVVKELDLFPDSGLIMVLETLRSEKFEFNIGVKTLVMICEMVRQEENPPSTSTFLNLLREEALKNRNFRR